jgi:HEAT repeat protein
LLLLILADCATAQEGGKWSGRSSDEWAQLLSDKDTVSEASESLLQGGPDAVPVIRSILKSGKPLAVTTAVWIAGQLGTDATSAAPELVELLAFSERGDLRLSSLAAAVLEDLGVAALDELRRGLSNPNARVRGWCAELIGHLGEGASPCVGLLASVARTDPDLMVRGNAIGAIGCIGPADDPRVRGQAGPAVEVASK